MSLKNRLDLITQEIHDEAVKSGRDPKQIKLLAVSKGQNVEKIEQAFLEHLSDFGENYLQEALEKMKKLQHLAINWHFIGPIQSNKAATIAENFNFVHSVCRLKIAEQLHLHRPAQLPPLPICIQINFDKEQTKQGLFAEDAIAFIKAIQPFNRLSLKGLMMIPKPLEDEQAQYESFLRLTTLMTTLNQKLALNMDTLSMGMSDDWRAAVRAGTTLLRLGTAVFGPRQQNH